MGVVKINDVRLVEDVMVGYTGSIVNTEFDTSTHYTLLDFLAAYLAKFVSDSVPEFGGSVHVHLHFIDRM
jgi:hypothetical protein